MSLRTLVMGGDWKKNGTKKQNSRPHSSGGCQSKGRRDVKGECENQQFFGAKELAREGGNGRTLTFCREGLHLGNKNKKGCGRSKEGEVGKKGVPGFIEKTPKKKGREISGVQEDIVSARTDTKRSEQTVERSYV